jgi:hypothetical protein
VAHLTEKPAEILEEVVEEVEELVAEVEEGQTARTPLLVLTGVTLAVGVAVAVVLTLAFLVYLLA